MCSCCGFVGLPFAALTSDGALLNEMVVQPLRRQHLTWLLPILGVSVELATFVTCYMLCRAECCQAQLPTPSPRRVHAGIVLALEAEHSPQSLWIWTAPCREADGALEERGHTQSFTAMRPLFTRARQAPLHQPSVRA